MPRSPDRHLIDVSQVIEHGTVIYKGLPAPLVCDCLCPEASRAPLYAPGSEFYIGKIEMVGNTGTRRVERQTAAIAGKMARALDTCALHVPRASSASMKSCVSPRI